MNKFLKGMLALGLSATALVGCSSGGDDAQSDEGTASGAITVVSREDGSGTRGAFTELMGIEEDGTDNTTSSAQITNSTSVMMTTVEGNPYAIGYISLGSLNDTVKAVTVDGVEATVENVESGEYTVSRPFLVCTTEDISELGQDFMNFIMSDEGQAIVEEEGYIPRETTGAFTSNGASGDLTVGGSSSVTPVMEKLAEAYEEINTGANVSVQQSDSTSGAENTISGVYEIGMCSRDLTEEEQSKGLTPTTIALDGIAVIVNKENAVDNLTTDQIKQIYTGEITDWADISE
ncbi:substrate-binding domain-containing protein [Faecalicoccus pleomorphus]|uniref:substrate-binding domain-containing protein n=1 Tax=Faecalicoccus pleomorphus TaxID=1323 RepID=UPI00143058BB|nr:substrate-binding domain-containing protein [Faecalicoccus pleomorphus]MBM6678855.1 substrate-binding domain-containing protein [Faecalicoccus pleomorphus]MBM6766005.1 substrate-binding domain-containing protein [Faecalicoccus pleomorphus]MBM6808358.1 substrate-binding domain-containing protein [Faecalicoccus pleomorphus]MDM8293432.1 substrate-binding domain-containing protein [Faecalicoccus pleomorphus]NJE41314.1 phosphate ABC transporter substrate-binding protein [Faecalicoccus pleomorphu